MQESYSLQELCSLLGGVIESELSQTYRVRAEISSINIHGGHCYMELVEKADNTGILAAKMRAVCWSNLWSMLSQYFIHETGQALTAGMQVLFEAEVRFHAVYGLSLQISGIDPSYTLGELALQRKRTIERLESEGMLQLQQMLKLPTLPRRIAVISSSDAAGYEDFCNQLSSSGFYFSTNLYVATMQGDRSAVSVANALQRIFDEMERYDAVVIIRGGGASTDLSCFDNYELALHIAQFPLPVITGIGHTRDISVADMVAHKSLKTPTAVAEYFADIMQHQLDRLKDLDKRLAATADKRITFQNARLEKLRLLFLHRTQHFLQTQQNRLIIAEKTISLLSPEDIFRKGYSVARANGKIIRSIKDLQTGEEIITEVADGKIISVVKEL
ncbi:MAG: exodeoxyribonuclease VII large subunit [Paludibacteraceae bacterium]|nr:exodeoxyribonuclease VII large subunit [Paludibacteraceae bacterium]